MFWFQQLIASDSSDCSSVLLPEASDVCASMIIIYRVVLQKYVKAFYFQASLSLALWGSHPAFLVVITSAPGSVPGIYVMVSVVKEEVMNLLLWPNIFLNFKAFTFRYMPFAFIPLSKALTQQTIGDPRF